MVVISGWEWETTISCERSAEVMMSCANGASRSGCRLVSGSFSTSS
jgi:hypothetical protein